MRDKVRTINNVPTKDLLLLLAQANQMGCPYVDLHFNLTNKTLNVEPIAIEEVNKRFDEGHSPLSMDELIDES